MGHAATATPTDSASASTGAGEYSAYLRLRQGSSARATWVIEESAGGTMLSIGSDEACDWQVRAAFVPPRAFSILVVGGRTFVRSGPEPGVLVNGKPIDDGWNELPENARIDIGLARLEVTSGYQEHADEPVLELAANRRTARSSEPGAQAQGEIASEPSRVFTMAAAPEREPTSLAVVRSDDMRTPARSSGVRRKTMETQDYASPTVQKAIAEAKASLRTRGKRDKSASKKKPLNTTIELKLEDLDYVGTIPLRGRSERHDSEHSGEYEVAPSLLGSDERTAVSGQGRNWRYAVFGLSFVGAYSGWLYLLDRL
jgi:predicted component of type VI protein secretion system